MQKDRSIFIILALTFGALGVHNFYAGYNGKGLAQLLITFFLWWLILPIIGVVIWAIIEAIVIKEDGKGNKMLHLLD